MSSTTGSGSSGSSAALETSTGEFADYMKATSTKLRIGQVLPGTVTTITKDYVSVDIGFKSEGLIPSGQFRDMEGKTLVKPGDVVDVYIIQLESDDGQLLLSREKAEQKKVWDRVEAIFKANETLTGKITHKVKGGLQVDIGIPAFLPGSQVDIRPHRSLDRFINESFDYKVLKITRDKGNIVLSRRAVLLNERDALRGETLKVLSEGVVMEGTVKNITEYGAFIDLGGIDGLLHISDITWGRINHPSERLTVGASMPVVVLKFDKDKERVSLGMKQLKEDPWKNVAERFPVNKRVSGKVTSVVDYGAFVELEEGIEGLIHVSEMSWLKKSRNAGKLVNVGDDVEAMVLGIDSESQRISLGMKQLMPNPWDELRAKHPIGSQVKGVVRSITDFGVFIGIEDGIDGLVHVSDFSWTKRVKDPKEIAEMFKKGDEIQAVVLDIDASNERLSLGIKQLTTDPWDMIPQRYPAGSKIKGVVTSITDFGVFLQIEEGVEGLIHSSQLGVERGQSFAELFPIGKEMEAEVTQIDRAERRISLSLRAVKRREEKQQMAEFMEDNGGSAVTFGDLLRQKMSEK